MLKHSVQFKLMGFPEFGYQSVFLWT